MQSPLSMLTFRAATAADVDAVVTLVESAYRGDASREGWTTEAHLLDGQRTDAGSVAALVAADDGEVVLVEEGGDLVGCCHLQVSRDGRGYFGLFAVRPRLQGRGTGRALLGEVERRAVAAGATTMRMTVLAPRAELIAWYERLGYRRTGEQMPFPHGDERFGIPRRDDLVFDWFEKALA